MGRPARPSAARPSSAPLRPTLRPAVRPAVPRPPPTPPPRPPWPTRDWQDKRKHKWSDVQAKRLKKEHEEKWEEWQEDEWEEWEWEGWEEWEEEEEEDCEEDRPTEPRRQEARKAVWPAKVAPKAVPKAPKVPVKARLPEELGFNVGSGVRKKGWEIGQMEDGVRPADDGEPDMFISHSYTENCRRVDMALFECDCPNSLTCCSHLYAAAVALPEYRHRAALLWAMRQDLGFRAGGHDFEHVSNGPRGGFAAARKRLKTALLKRLSLDELAECALDASLGLWARVEWLRLGQRPKLEKFWLHNVQKVLSAGSESTDGGRALQERLKAFLRKLDLKESEVGPLLLALAQGHCDDTRSAKWAKVSERFWSQLVGEKPKKDTPKAPGHSEAELRLAAVSAALEAARETSWPQLTAAEKLWRSEERLLKNLGATSFASLTVPKANSEEVYRSFVEFIADWPEAPAELQFSGQTSGAPEVIEREVAMLLSELGLPQSPEALQRLLKFHFGHGEDADWAETAQCKVEATEQSTAVMTAIAASWPWHTMDVQATLLAVLAKDGWEEAAIRSLQVAPSMTDLRDWLHWDAIFQPQLGALRRFLKRSAPPLGLAIFELPARRFLKLDLSKGTCEAFEAALLAMDTGLATEAMLAFIHSSGGMRGSPLEALKPCYRKVAEQLKEPFARVAGSLLAALPRAFHFNLEVIEMIVEPFREHLAGLSDFAEAAGWAGEHAALMLNTPSLQKPLLRRLTAQATPPPQPRPTPRTAEVAVARSSEPPLVGPENVETNESKVPEGSAEELIATIRREEFGFNGEELSGGALQAKQNARLARALKRLAGELYGSDVHWQLELLQNADDNSYEEGVVPTAQFLLRHIGEVIFRCNEVGFREADVRAICDIGNSSKVGIAKYGVDGRVVATGEKGLGFKAVFSISDRPKLFSGPYRLEFDATHPSGIGYVLPRWLQSHENELLRPSWGSALRLPLRSELQDRKEELFHRLASLPPSLLLFMKRLREVSVLGDFAGSPSLHVKYSEELPHRWKEFFGPLKLQVSHDGGVTWELEHWLLMRRLVKVPHGLTKPGIASSPPSTLLELALPLDDEGGFQCGRGSQQVFAFLPVRSYGLPFALQADWAVSSSREDILSGCSWNEFLKAEVPDLLLSLVDAVKSRETPLKWSFYSAVPVASSVGSFFRPAIVQLHQRLRGAECMLTDEGVFCLPPKACRCPSEARECLGLESPLRKALRAQGLHLLHEKVESFASVGLLDSLGVLRLNASQLLRLLPCIEDFRMSQWRQLLALLDQLLDMAPKGDVARLLEVCRQLPLLPKQGVLHVCRGLVLPPEQREGFPPELLAELHAVDPRLLEGEDQEGDQLALARVRKLLRRLGIAPLTPRMVMKDVLGPLFQGTAVPSIIPVSEAPRPSKALLALGGFLVAHRHLADELNGPVGWPLEDLEQVAVGTPFAPALHSAPSSFVEAAKGVLKLRLPAVPSSLDVPLGEALVELGLAIPGPMVIQSAGDWRSPEFEALALAIAAEARQGKGVTRARSLAKALNASWRRFERYCYRDDGAASSFLLTLQSTRWLPADTSAEALSLPGDLLNSTVEIRSVFAEEFLQGLSCSVVNGEFAKALGVMTKPSVDLALKVLRSLERCSPVGPEIATAVYSFLQEQGADLTLLRSHPSVVVARNAPGRLPSDTVWEDPHGATSLPILQRLYHAKWRHFFIALGVPESPTPEQVLQHIDNLSGSSPSQLWPPLIHLAERLGDEAWDQLASQLKLRQCIPLQSGCVGTPEDGVFVDDGVLPVALVARLRAAVALADVPPCSSELWSRLCGALGLQKLSVCNVAPHYLGEGKLSAIGKAISDMLLPAQRYLYSRHRSVYQRPEAFKVAQLLEDLRILEVGRPLLLKCDVSDVNVQLEVDSYMDIGSESARLLLVPGASLAAICVELARLLVPGTQDAREALTTFLASVSAGAAEEVCAALQVPPLEDCEKPWPVPKKVLEQLQAEHLEEPTQDPPVEEEPPPKRQRKENYEAEHASRSREVATQGRQNILQDCPEAEENKKKKTDISEENCAEVEEILEGELTAETLLQNISVGKDDARGPAERKERKPHDVGKIFSHLPGSERPGRGHIVAGSDPLEDQAPRTKEFRTRVYDLDDLREQKKRMKIDPLPRENTLPKEEREKVGRWGEQFVYHYLKTKLEAEDSGKRVIWVNEVEETGFQYDLRIEDGKGEVDAYVEVKTSRAKDKQLFEISYREWIFAQKEGARFVIFRVSNAGKEDVELCSITNPFRQWKELNLGLCLSF